MQMGAYKLGNARKDDAQRAALRQIKQWTRERFSLSDDDLAIVTEETGKLPGVPELVTMIVFQCAADGMKRHHLIFKPAVEVREDDIPPAWMKNALITPDGYQCSCC
jgi:nitrate reductase delta subunit